MYQLSVSIMKNRHLSAATHFPRIGLLPLIISIANCNGHGSIWADRQTFQAACVALLLHLTSTNKGALPPLAFLKPPNGSSTKHVPAVLGAGMQHFAQPAAAGVA